MVNWAEEGLMKIRSLLWLSAFIISVGCSGTNVGDGCTSDDQCGSFKCLRDQRAVTNTCVDVPVPDGNCSPPCRTHADCTKYGATLKCALSQTDVTCNPTGICRDNYQITCNPGPCREAPAN